jgi:hypothetical protein
MLLVLCTVGATAIGLALGRASRSRLGEQGARVVSLLPALALAVAALLGRGGPTDPSLYTLGHLGAAVAAIVAAVAILAKSIEVSRL